MDLSRRNCSIVFILFLIAPSCATTTDRSSYPRKQIDRPFALPKGFASLHTRGESTYFHSQNSSDFFLFPPYPLTFDWGFADSWTLSWSLVNELALRLKFSNSEKRRADDSYQISMSVSGLNYVTNRMYLGLNPSFTYKHRIGENIAFEGDAYFSHRFKFYRTEKRYDSALIRPLVHFQLSEVTALRAGASLAYEAEDAEGWIDGAWGLGNSNRFSVGAQLGIHQSLSTSWDLGATFYLSRTFGENIYWTASGVIVVSHYFSYDDLAASVQRFVRP